MPLTSSDISHMELRTLQLVEFLFKKKGKWSEPTEFNIDRFKKLFANLNSIWGTNTQLNIDFDNHIKYTMTSGGEYNPSTKTIHLYFPSLMTALHEWKHALQHFYPEYTKSDDIEVDAQKWSHTIFKRVFPNLYRKNLETNKFFHSPSELFPLELDRHENRAEVEENRRMEIEENRRMVRNLIEHITNSVHNTISQMANHIINPSENTEPEVIELSKEFAEKVETETKKSLNKKIRKGVSK